MLKKCHDILLNYIKSKLPKQSILALQIVNNLLTNFGPSSIDNLKPFLTDLKKLFEGNLEQRKEVFQFFQESYKFLGDALLPLI